MSGSFNELTISHFFKKVGMGQTMVGGFPRGIHCRARLRLVLV